MSRVIITSYRNPDLDGVSCAYAYAELFGKTDQKAIAMIDSTPTIEAAWMLHKLGISLPQLSVTQEDVIVLVDTNHLDAIHSSIKPEQVIEIIDHHQYGDAKQFTQARVQIEFVGAAATLIAEKFKTRDMIPSAAAATLLYAGITSNTLNFKASVTTERDITMAEWLRGITSISDGVIQEMFRVKSDFTGKNIKEVILLDLNRPKQFGAKKISWGQLEMIGVNKLLTERLDEIKKALWDINKSFSSDYCILSCIDLDEGTTTFIYNTSEEKKIIQSILDVKENDSYLIYPKVILRKEILPLLVEQKNIL